MKVLTIRQPYADLVAKGIKNVENRTRHTNYRGEILIHAAATMHERVSDINKLVTTDQYDAMPRLEKSKLISGLVNKPYTMGAIIGKAEIVDSNKFSRSVWAEKGQFHWQIANAVLFDKPILNIKGQLGLWNIEFCRNCSNVGEIYECEICEKDFCDNCSATFTVHNQIDFNCCADCADERKQYRD